MHKITKDWASKLDAFEVEAVLSLGTYNRQCMLLFFETDRYFHATVEDGINDAEKSERFIGFFLPCFKCGFQWCMLFMKA